MNLKKTLILLVAVCMVFLLCACSSKSDPAPSDNAATPSPTAAAVPEASPDADDGANTPPVSQQERGEKAEQPDPVTITAAEAESIALSDAMTDRGEPQNVKSYEAREGDRVIGWNVEFDLAGQHMIYLIDLVTGGILDAQYS